MEFVLDNHMLGQIAGFVALALCIVAFANKDDDRLLAVLILGNVAFAVQFALFGAWAASGISALIVLRIFLARRMPGSLGVTLLMIGATIAIAVVTWESAIDLFPLAAGVAGTISMCMLRGVPMRLGLVFAGLCWMITNALVGSVGALAAETLIVLTNVVTILRVVARRPRPLGAASRAMKSARSAYDERVS